MHRTADITGLILAGGQGSRMGGADKGLVAFRGRPLAAWTLERFRPQVDRILISANRNPEQYRALGADVIPDLLPDFPGPLAGVQAGLSRLETPLLATCPCDSPLLPLDLVARLRDALDGKNALLAVARLDGQLQPAFMLCRQAVRASLDDWLTRGERRFAGWQKSLGAIAVDFDDCPESFTNFNNQEDLARFTSSEAVRP